jgi:hypothetical protein
MTQYGDTYMQVSGIDKASQTIVVDCWNVLEDDGYVQAGRSYLVHGFRAQKLKLNQVRDGMK